MFPFSGMLNKKNKQKLCLRSQLLRLSFLKLEKLKGFLNPKLIKILKIKRENLTMKTALKTFRITPHNDKYLI